MKYYEELVDLQCFSRADVVTLTGNEHTADSLIAEYKRKGYIQSVRRNSYVTISLETKMPVANRYRIATNIMSGSYITHHSAFEYYGCANQVFHEVYVSTASRFSDFTYDGITYARISPEIHSGVITANTGIRVTDLERTVIDSIHSFERIGGLEELLRCLMLVPALRTDKLIIYLDDYGLANLYQKTGYILTEFSEQLGLSKVFFDYCRSRIPKSKKYLYAPIESRAKHLILHEDWMIYAPRDLKSIISKGVDLNA